MRHSRNGKGNAGPLLVVGQGLAATGFARVLHNVLENLKGLYEIHHFARNYRGAPVDVGWKIYPNSRPGDVYGVAQLGPLVERLRPRLVLLLDDPLALTLHLEVLEKYASDLKVFVYCPIEDDSFPPSMLRAFTTAARFVAYTNFGKRVVEEALDSARREWAGLSFPRIEVLPHGVDTGMFYPYARSTGALALDRSRAQARRLLFPDGSVRAGDFIVLNANRNQPRKRIDLTIRGFSLFARNKPDNVKLYLHMGVKDRARDVLLLAQVYGITDRLLMTNDSSGPQSVPNHKLNLIYNACDVGINTAFSEGWGLISFEHAATGAAQLVPGYDVFAELWGNSATLIGPTQTARGVNPSPTERQLSPRQVADALEQLYRDEKYLKEMSLAAYENATRPEYHWEHISKRWHALFQNV